MVLLLVFYKATFEIHSRILSKPQKPSQKKFSTTYYKGEKDKLDHFSEQVEGIHSWPPGLPTPTRQVLCPANDLSL